MRSEQAESHVSRYNNHSNQAISFQLPSASSLWERSHAQGIRQVARQSLQPSFCSGNFVLVAFRFPV